MVEEYLNGILLLPGVLFLPLFQSFVNRQLETENAHIMFNTKTGEEEDTNEQEAFIDNQRKFRTVSNATEAKNEYMFSGTIKASFCTKNVCFAILCLKWFFFFLLQRDHVPKNFKELPTSKGDTVNILYQADKHNYCASINGKIGYVNVDNVQSESSRKSIRQSIIDLF